MIEKTDKISFFLKKLFYDFKRIDVFIIKKFFIINIIFYIYLTLTKPNLLLVVIYGLVIVLAILAHYLFIKGYHQEFNNNNRIITNEVLFNLEALPIRNNKFLLFRMLFLQARIYLISNWLLNTALLHGEIKDFLEPSYDLLINGWISWLFLISLLLGLGYYKYKFTFSNMRLANCLLTGATTPVKITLYNYLLGVETYTRLASFIVLIVVSLVSFIEMIIKKLNLYSFLAHPLISSLICIFIFMYCRKKLVKLIDFLCKKLSMSFISVLATMFLLILTIVFVVNELILNQVEVLNMLSSPTDVAPKIIKSLPFNQYTLRILFLGLNIVLVFGAASDVFLKQINGYKISTIYYASTVFPLLYSLLCYKSNFNLALYEILNKESFSCLMILLILSIFKFNYNDIYHILCMFGIKITDKDSNKLRKIKVDFSSIIQSTLNASIVFLSGYYIFSWLLVEYAVALGALLILPIIIVLLISVLIKNKKHENRILNLANL